MPERNKREIEEDDLDESERDDGKRRRLQMLGKAQRVRKEDVEGWRRDKTAKHQKGR